MTKIQKLITLGSAYGSALLLHPASVLATAAPEGDRDTITIIGNRGTARVINDFQFSNILMAFINAVLGLVGIIAFFMLLVGGVQWLLSGGDKEGTEKARKRITAALIGLAIVFSAYALIFVLQTFFGVNLLQFNIPSFNGSR